MLALVLVLVLPLAAPAFPQEAEPPALRPGEVVEGVIEDDDEVVETETLRADGYTREHAVRGKTFLVQVDEPETYRVELRSDLFDGYLVLRSASGEVLAEDDDGLIGTHSRVVRELTPTDTLRIAACALHGGRGRFEVRLEQGEAPNLSPQERAQAEIAEARRRLAAVEAARGPEHSEVADCLYHLAKLLRAQADHQGVRPLLERALGIREQALGKEHPDVALGLNSLALLLQSQGDYVGARPLYERALGIYEHALGTEHLYVATSLNNLAQVLSAQGDYTTARLFHERALGIRERALGTEHPDVASSLNNLAQQLAYQGDYAGAQPLLERALRILEQSLGPEHPQVASSLTNLAQVLSAQGDYAGARPLCERALVIFERDLGKEHANVAWSLNNLAQVRSAQGDYAGARPLYERALSILERVLGQEHPHVANCLNNLAMLLYSQGDYAEARPLHERALAIRERVLGKDDPAVATSLNNLAILLYAQGDHAEAMTRSERGLRIIEQTLGREHPDLAPNLNTLAGLLHAQGDHAAARPLYERALAILERARGKDHPHVASSLDNLAGLLEAQGDYAGARPLHERALAIYEHSLGREHPDVAKSLHHLAALSANLGAHREAVDFVTRAEARRSPFLGRTLAALSESECHRYLAELRWQQEIQISSLAWGAAPIAVYESLLAWKGQVLRLAKLGHERLAALLEPAMRDKLAQLHAIQAEMSRATTGARGMAGEYRDVRSLEALIAERSRLERDLRDAGNPWGTDAPSWEEVRQALPARHALVDLFAHRVYEAAEWEGERLVRPGRWAPERVSAWITRGDMEEPLRCDLGTAAGVEAAVRASLQEHIANARGGSLGGGGDPSDALRRLVWDPLAEHLEGVEMVFVSPDGVLASLPFEILRGEDGRYSVEVRGFVYLTDPAILVETAGRELCRESRSLLAVGSVDYERAEGGAEDRTDGALEADPLLPGSSRVTSGAVESRPRSDLSRGGWTNVWRPLDATRPEVAQVLRWHEVALTDGARLLLHGATATEERLKLEMPRHAVLHLATHGYFQPDGFTSLEDAAEIAASAELGHDWQESVFEVARRLEGYHPALLSGLVCAGVNRNLSEEVDRERRDERGTRSAGDAMAAGTKDERAGGGEPAAASGDDGYLTAEEVSWLDLSGVDLAVLSACDTGLGRPQSGEGLLGLRRSFLMAGSKTVVSSLWSVGDQETAAFMDLFYRNLWQRGMGKCEALRAAQLETIEKNRAEHGHARPATWGAFVLDGDWR